ncbi:UvrD-helicase domain-containing protein [Verrucomicrobiaceae bacterium R5-34]|nr:UvrD-helicase domain-containing protein [Verrucomicrobiaceae bacterium R5-34]
MSAMIQSTMIRASAGSGKTWQLANRYLSLMVLGAAPEKIIALTFTRKAAGEFTSRIMTRLADGAADEEAAAKLSAELTEVIVGTDSIPPLVTAKSDGSPVVLPTMDAGYFQKKLEQLVAALDRLALSTLDSYFVRIVRNFALELGLSGFDLMDDSAIAAERMAVMTQIFSNRLTSEKSREAFLQSFKQATWGEEENRLAQTLEDFVQNHQNRWLSAPEAEKWGGESLLWRSDQGGCPFGDGKLAELSQLLRASLGPPVSPHVTYMKGWHVVCDLLEQHVPGAAIKMNAQLKRALPRWQEFAQGGLIDNAKYEITPEQGALMSALLGVFIKGEIEIRMKRTQGLHAVISAYEDSYHQHVRSRGRLCFSDLTMLLAGEGAMEIWEPDARELIDYRLDARYDHWLLDEFQDTSQPQWKAVGTLVDEVLQDPEGERSVFVVGDSKQSIYGWRGGEPRLFDDLQEHYGQALAEWNMDRSYRSSQHVLDLVNCVCDLSDPKWREIFPAKSVDRWSFHSHMPSGEKAGHSLVLETTADPSADSAEKQQARYALVKELLVKTQPLKNHLTCAVLVSKNAQAAGLVEYLRSELPEMPVAPETETLVSDGPEGAVILDLFRWLRNPSDDFARHHLSYTPLAQVVQTMTGHEKASAQWSWLTAEIARKGLAPLVQDLVHGLREQVEVSDYGESRLEEILTAAWDFSARGGSLDDWISLLESRKVKENTRDGMIQIMTVHKSKGLGFDMVILPELGGQDFAATSRLEMLERKGELGKTEFIIRKPAKEFCEADRALSEMLNDWEADQCYERFCNLYVAITRAKHATYCILDPVKDNWTPGRKYDDWIREATARAGDGEIEIAGQIYPLLFASGDWLDISGDGEADSEQEPAPIVLQPAQARMGRKIASGAKAAKIGSLLESGKGLAFGNRVHALFEKITWLDELPDFDDQPSSQAVKACLESAGISEFFRRPSGEFQLLREQPIETQHEGQWVSGIIDRAVIHFENGQVTEVSIIDFKTDLKDAAELRDAYSQQLAIYRQAMAGIFQISEDQITCHLLSTSLKQMVEV